MIEVQYTMYIFLFISGDSILYIRESIKVMTGGRFLFLFYGCGAIQCILMYSLNHYHKCFATKRSFGRSGLTRWRGRTDLWIYGFSHRMSLQSCWFIACSRRQCGVFIWAFLNATFLSVIFSPFTITRCLTSQHVIMKVMCTSF